MYIATEQRNNDITSFMDYKHNDETLLHYHNGKPALDLNGMITLKLKHMEKLKSKLPIKQFIILSNGIIIHHNKKTS